MFFKESNKKESRKTVHAKQSFSTSVSVYTTVLLMTVMSISGCELLGQNEVYYLDIRSADSVQGHTSPKSREYEAGSEVTIQARPHDSWGWAFDRWEGDITGTENPVSFTINRDMKVVAHFKGKDLPLTIEIVGEGHVEHRILGSGSYSDDPKPMYPHGSRVQILAVPAEGWRFDVWRGQNFTFNRLTNPEDFNMLGSRTVRAYFVPDN